MVFALVASIFLEIFNCVQLILVLNVFAQKRFFMTDFSKQETLKSSMGSPVMKKLHIIQLGLNLWVSQLVE